MSDVCHECGCFECECQDSTPELHKKICALTAQLDAAKSELSSSQTLLAERDVEIALLRKQSVGWVQVFDENSALRAEVQRLTERLQANAAKIDEEDVVIEWADYLELKAEARKQAAQECIEEAVLWIPTASVAKYRRIMALKFGLEG